jgi:hypothetical protein
MLTKTAKLFTVKTKRGYEYQTVMVALIVPTEVISMTFVNMSMHSDACFISFLIKIIVLSEIVIKIFLFFFKDSNSLKK